MSDDKVEKLADKFSKLNVKNINKIIKIPKLFTATTTKISYF